MFLKSLYTKGKIDKQELVKRRFVQFRDLRDKQFQAFDIYKSNVLYGIEQETEQQKTAIINWYNNMRDFPDSITEDTVNSDYPVIPSVIEKYL